MAQPNRTRQALLGFLSWGPMSGYDLRGVIDGSISNFWSESYGRIYPMLNRLVDEGLATREETETPGGRPRKVYSITKKGRAAFEGWLDEPVSPRPLRNELLLKLFFAARGASADPVAMVESFRDEEREKRARYAEIRARLESAQSAPDDMSHWLQTLRYGELEVESHLAWCDEVIADLRRSGPG